MGHGKLHGDMVVKLCPAQIQHSTNNRYNDSNNLPLLLLDQHFQSTSFTLETGLFTVPYSTVIDFSCFLPTYHRALGTGTTSECLSNQSAHNAFRTHKVVMMLKSEGLVELCNLSSSVF